MPAALKGAAQKQPYEDLLKGVPINPSLARSIPGAKIRSKQEILARHGGSLERDQYFGQGSQANRGLNKEQLAQKMTFGYVLPDLPAEGNSVGAAGKGGSSSRGTEEEQMRDQIIGEIDERKEFLDAMRAAGRGKEHEDAILGQISERLQDLRTLENLSKDA